MAAMNLFFIIFLFLFFLFTIGVSALIGILVYKDATKKEMNSPILWALLAVFAPSFIGLIIYFIVRSSYPKNNFTPNTSSSNASASHTNGKKMVCPFCGCSVESTYVACPHCGTRLQQESTESKLN